MSGSPVMYGPVAISTCSHYKGGKPFVNLVENEDTIFPSTHFVPNGGCYRVDYTGDIGVFPTNTFSLVNTGMKMRTGRVHTPRNKVSPANDWVVVIETHYTYPGKINGSPPPPPPPRTSRHINCAGVQASA